MDTIAFMVVIYFSVKSEKSPDKPELGPFRIKPDALAAQLPAKRAAPRRAIGGR